MMASAIDYRVALGNGRNCVGVADEWHVDLVFSLKLGKLGSYPVAPL
jgi:hypothetical protein